MVQAGPIVDCHAEYSRQASTSSSLSLVDFDQKTNSGWRVLADARCFEEAGKMIKQYIEINGPQSSLFLHLGQIELRLDRRSEAKESFLLALRENEKNDEKFKFNDFSLALAAYAAGDIQEFNKHYEIIEENSENFGNKMNLKLLKKCVIILMIHI